MLNRIFLGFLTLLCTLGLILAWMPDRIVWQVFEMTVFGVTGLWAVAWLAGFTRASWTWMLLPFAGILIWSAVQWRLHLTVYGLATETDLIRWAAYACIFLLAFQTAEEKAEEKNFVFVLAMFGMMITAESVFQYFTGGGKIYWQFTPGESASGFGPFLNHDHFASFIALILPVAAVSIRDRSRGSWAFVIVMAGFYAAVVTSASRAGFAVVTLEVLILFALLKVPMRAFAPALALMVVFAGIVGWERLYGRYQEVNSFASRREVARVTTEIIKKSPWTGTGMGTWTLMYPEYAERDIGLTANAAHDDWLQWTSEGGVILTALIGALVIGSIMIVRRVPWALGVPMVFLHSIIDFPLQGRFLPAMLFLILAVAARRHLAPAPVEAPRPQSRRIRSMAQYPDF